MTHETMQPLQVREAEHLQSGHCFEKSALSMTDMRVSFSVPPHMSQNGLQLSLMQMTDVKRTGGLVMS